MPRDVSQNMRTQMYGTEMPSVPLVILDIDTHTEGVDVIHVVNNNENIVFNSIEYEAVAFKFKPPDEEEATVSSAQISISNVDRRILKELRAFQGIPTITARVLLVTGSTIEEEAGPWVFELRGINYNHQTITGNIVYEFKYRRKLSTIRYVPALFPSLYTP